jgi:hypothetical protein
MLVAPARCGRVRWRRTGSFVLIPSNDGTVRIWDPATGSRLTATRTAGAPTACLVYPDLSGVAAVGYTGHFLHEYAEMTRQEARRKEDHQPVRNDSQPLHAE